MSETVPESADSKSAEKIIGDDDRPPISLEQLRLSMRPMTVLEKVERAALGTETMTKPQLVAARLFLAKTQPDLKATEVTGPDGGPVRFMVQASPTDEKL